MTPSKDSPKYFLFDYSLPVSHFVPNYLLIAIMLSFCVPSSQFEPCELLTQKSLNTLTANKYDLIIDLLSLYFYCAYIRYFSLSSNYSESIGSNAEGARDSTHYRRLTCAYEEWFCTSSGIFLVFTIKWVTQRIRLIWSIVSWSSSWWHSEGTNHRVARSTRWSWGQFCWICGWIGCTSSIVIRHIIVDMSSLHLLPIVFNYVLWYHLDFRPHIGWWCILFLRIKKSWWKNNSMTTDSDDCSKQ